MTKKIKVITIQQNQLLEIPNDNIEIEHQEDNEDTPVIVDNTENQELPLDVVEAVEPQDVKLDLTIRLYNFPYQRRKNLLPYRYNLLNSLLKFTKKIVH